MTFVTDEAIQVHLATKDIHAGFNARQNAHPVAIGHIVYRGDDIGAFKAQ